MIYKFFGILMLCIISNTLIIFGQTKEDKEKAHKIAVEAVQKMDNGAVDVAIDMLIEASKLDSANISYNYEIAYAYYLKKEYQTSLKICLKLVKLKNSEDIHYQMLGNIYDIIGEKENAIKTYKEGLKKFPKSSKFHTELGILYFYDKNYNEAINNWEKGIELEPTYTSNYYWAAKLFSNSKEKIWALLYSEMYLNIERNNGERLKEISKLMYQTLRSCYTKKGDTVQIDFTAKNVINATNKKEIKKLKNGIMPFELTYGTVFIMSSPFFPDSFSIKNINTAKLNFIDIWFNQKKINKYYRNILFDYQKVLISKNYFDCYNYWINSYGDTDEFIKWKKDNEKKFGEFVKWYNANPIKLNEKNKLYRLQYE
jgi:tetratricopeptide (TPR) repeat protein